MRATLRPLCVALTLLPGPALAQEGATVEAEALFQSCGNHRLGRGCMFHGETMSYLASESAQTDQALLDRLAGVAPGTRMRIAGTVAFDFSDTGLLFLKMTEAEPGGSDPHADLRAALQGEWVYAADPDYGIRVDAAEWNSLYGGQVAGTAALWIADGCPGGGATGRPALVLRTEFDVPGEHACFDLAEFSPERMVLIQSGDPQPAEWTRP